VRYQARGRPARASPPIDPMPIPLLPAGRRRIRLVDVLTGPTVLSCVLVSLGMVIGWVANDLAEGTSARSALVERVEASLDPARRPTLDVWGRP